MSASGVAPLLPSASPTPSHATVQPALPALPCLPLHIARLDAFVFRAAIRTPVRTSFGTMVDRPAVFVRAEDAAGVVGWGEAWCNFPSCGAEHRGRLIDSVIAPLIVGRSFDSPAAAFAAMTERTAVLAIQSGEPGPVAQAIAGVDLALWDLCAKLAGEPLWRLLGGSDGHVATYASGINPDGCAETTARALAGGQRAFKLKIGFDADRDLDNIAAMRAAIGPDLPLMLDANQAWTLDQALRIAPRLEAFGIGWLEEPLRADRPWAEWQVLKEATRIMLAGGENVSGEAAFAAAIDADVLGVVQPDIAKWGGISGCWPVIARIRAAGLRYCPHYLGAGIGLLASAHLLAAAGSDGLLEIDANENPLRTALCGPLASIDEGRADLGEAAGIGVDVDPIQVAGLCGAAARSSA